MLTEALALCFLSGTDDAGPDGPTTAVVDAPAERERDKKVENIFFTSAPFNTGDAEADRKAAAEYGKSGQNIDIEDEPFTPHFHGAAQVFFEGGCHWPADEYGDLADVNKEGLPETADLEFGVTAYDVVFWGIKKAPDGSFFALFSGDVNYADKEDGTGNTAISEPGD